MQQGRSESFVLVVEDHPLVADSLVAWVRSCDAGLEVEIVQSLGAALRVLAEHPAPLLIVTDLTLTDTRGADAVRHLREAAPNSPLLVFTALEDEALRREAMAAGATGYLSKSTSTQSLRDAISAVIGSIPGARRKPAENSGEQERSLTPKQRAVLEELAAGRSNKEIAKRLNLSDATVGSHMKEILSRLGARNRTEAVICYLEITDKARGRRKR